MRIGILEHFKLAGLFLVCLLVRRHGTRRAQLSRAPPAAAARQRETTSRRALLLSPRHVRSRRSGPRAVMQRPSGPNISDRGHYNVSEAATRAADLPEAAKLMDAASSTAEDAALAAGVEAAVT